MERAGTKIRTKIDKAKDPMAIIQASLKTASQVEQPVSSGYYRSNEVIDVGYYQDPSPFMLEESQSFVSPITPLQVPSYQYSPQSSWAQQWVNQPIDFSQPLDYGSNQLSAGFNYGR